MKEKCILQYQNKKQTNKKILLNEYYGKNLYDYVRF